MEVEVDAHGEHAASVSACAASQYGVRSDTIAAVHDLRTLRLAAGLTVRELAERAGTSHSTLVAYEQGRKVPRSDTRDRIIRAAGYVVPPPGPRRVVVNERGTARGVELADVLALADALLESPDRRQREPSPWHVPAFPERRGP